MASGRPAEAIIGELKERHARGLYARQHMRDKPLTDAQIADLALALAVLEFDSTEWVRITDGRKWLRDTEIVPAVPRAARMRCEFLSSGSGSVDSVIASRESLASRGIYIRAGLRNNDG